MPLEPSQINVDVERQTLLLRWEDGMQKNFSHANLRANCPCAFCRAKRFSQKDTHSSSEVTISAIYSQGYGIQICFSDGHDKGIFPWSYLRDLTL